jgi:hypothetical protein
MTNPCLRPASLSDVRCDYATRPFIMEHQRCAYFINRESLATLYDAEWRLRGFLRSP